MAEEHSVDIVSIVDIHEVSNAMQHAVKEISQWFDFKGSKSSIYLDKDKAEFALISDDIYKLNSLKEIHDKEILDVSLTNSKNAFFGLKEES